MTVTADTHELQFKRSPAQKWFMEIFKRTSAPILDAQKSFSNDSQGMYIIGADGTSYGYCNDHDPSNIHVVLDKSLKKFKAHPPKKVTVTDKEIHTAFAITPAPTTSVLRVFSRIRPVPKGVTGLNHSVGRDHMWIYPDEVKTLLAWSKQTPNGFKMPASVVLRFARYHLLDDVRGTPDMWDADEVRHVAFKAKTLRQSGNICTIVFTGSFKMRNHCEARGYEGTIEGELDLDSASQRVTRCRAVSSGKAWGDGTYTPNAPKGKYPLVIAFVEAHDAASQVVPPEAVSTENSDAKYHHP